MNRKIKIFMLTKIVLVLFLVGNFTTTHAADREWQAGDIFTFTDSINTIVTEYDLEYDVHVKTETINQVVGTFNVTEINLLSGRYYAIWTDPSGSGPNSGYDFYVDDYISTYLDNINSFLTVDYEWDYGTNSTKFVAFGISLSTWLLIEPDWAKLNTAFIDVFNESEIVETVADPYQPIIYNITLGDFLSSISYTFMGKNNLADAKSRMKSDTTEWSFVFDLSNVICEDILNGTLGYDEYYPSPKAILTYEMSYSKGGVLQRSLLEMDMTSLVDNYQGDIYFEILTTYGDLAALTGDFAYWMAIPGFLLIVAVVRIAKRKSNRSKR
ncbi:MAG: hypothetical protein KGD59_11220 [Candidatus Heimdallarchaeota archaeon]|nr:hypothetical protein [Candidatus Heimdallarchaeota archaeon]MBY8995112.1 hypothetical protein [Candidatus Heimdallarchaeota archaeon]